MASLGQRKSGAWYVQFVECKERLTISLGRLPDKKTAEGIRLRLEAILQSRKHNMPADRVTAEWIHGLSDDMHDELSKAGLIVSRKRSTLAQLIQQVLAEYENGNHSTWRVYNEAGRQLLTYPKFKDGSIDVREINNEQADAWVSWLKGRVGEASWTDYLWRARFFFKKAIRWGIVHENPFSGIRGGDIANTERQSFVSADLVHKMIRSTEPNFGAILALSRFGGLRIPSEVSVSALDWSNFNWNPGSFIVHSSKTKSRVVPLFPELREYLVRKTSGPVIRPISRNTMYTKMARLRAKFGIEWPRVFHNMRASRLTELVGDGWPLHIVCKWLGNTPRTANKHYLQVLPSDYDEAAALQDALQTVAAMTDQAGSGSAKTPRHRKKTG